ncbi:hypothetical protein ATCC19606_17480 [Acinetobacter baumannii]|uniref:Uncharacterized protein n=1 Tax=Acinetobacter baumannii TaxID=470 RepID=A0A6F8TG51_ACIBA|nr:hypothetical protein ATCC19606_17480 [Acinetobacter baumannii]
MKLLYKDGTNFINGLFYKHKLPMEKGELNHSILNGVIPLDCLLNVNLTEKDEDNLSIETFGNNSIFI